MYRILVAILRFLFLIWGLDVEGTENIPQEHGAIIAGNHRSWLDPVVIAVAIKRPIHFMAKAELFEYPILGWLVSRLHAFPVKRGQADRQAIRTSHERVTAGHLLGIFPEGTRNKTGDAMLPLQGGAVLIALRSGVPIVPVVVARGRRRGLRKRFLVRIGTPIDLGGPQKPKKEDIAQGSKAISAQFSSLLSRNN
ncbi:MAG: 1-acyl-sn-glycerol-3-phosphate acyltransferase [Firmicutes bacterium]|nr:1-acyl-sn-glycerol-3-phosphate acyltransferase [Bacillota bacterium]